MSTAYVVIVFQLEMGVPVFRSVGIFSEPTPTMSASYKSFVVFQQEGQSYSHARVRAMQAIEDSPFWALGWLLPLIERKT